MSPDAPRRPATLERDHDTAAARLAQRRQRRLHPEAHAVHVHREDRFPGRIGAAVEGAHLALDAGVEKHPVQPAEVLERRRDHALVVLPPANVHGEPHCALAQRLGDCLDGPGLAVSDHHACPLGVRHPRCGLADAARTAGYRDHFSLQAAHDMLPEVTRILEPPAGSG